MFGITIDGESGAQILAAMNGINQGTVTPLTASNPYWIIDGVTKAVMINSNAYGIQDVQNVAIYPFCLKTSNFKDNPPRARAMSKAKVRMDDAAESVNGGEMLLQEVGFAVIAGCRYG